MIDSDEPSPSVACFPYERRESRVVELLAHGEPGARSQEAKATAQPPAHPVRPVE